MKVMFFDIETVPEYITKPPQWQIDHINHKVKGKEDLAPIYWSTDPLVARVLCISYAINHDNATVLYAEKPEDESKMLADFNRATKDVDVFIHFNGLDFDVPFVLQRMRKFHIAVINKDFKFLARFRQSPHYDIMWELGNWKHKTKLDSYCSYFSIPTPKDDISGAEVLKCHIRGEHDRIIEYSRKDTEILKGLYNLSRI